MTPNLLNLTCSNRPRASVQSSRSKFGHQYWRRDVFHAAGDDSKTLCGVSTDGWLAIETRPAADAMGDPHFCNRCAAKVKCA